MTVRDGRFAERRGRDAASLHRRRPKTPITLWALTVWTYQRQKPHKASEGRIGPARSSLSQTGAVLRHVWSCGASSGACGVSRTYCDDDALAVHDQVLRLDRTERHLVIAAGETGLPPDWAPRLPPFRAMPVKGRKGRLYRGIYDRHGNEIGCEIAYDGFAPARAAVCLAQAREAYALWHAALTGLHAALSGGTLGRWLLGEVGVPRAPWA